MMLANPRHTTGWSSAIRTWIRAPDLPGISSPEISHPGPRKPSAKHPKTNNRHVNYRTSLFNRKRNVNRYPSRFGLVFFVFFLMGALVRGGSYYFFFGFFWV